MIGSLCFTFAHTRQAHFRLAVANVRAQDVEKKMYMEQSVMHVM